MKQSVVGSELGLRTNNTLKTYALEHYSLMKHWITATVIIQLDISLSKTTNSRNMICFHKIDNIVI